MVPTSGWVAIPVAAVVVWVTNLGDGVAVAAGPLLVAAQTRDPLLVALAVVLQRLPWLLFGLFAGVVADRLDRRRIVVVVHPCGRRCSPCWR